MVLPLLILAAYYFWPESKLPTGHKITKLEILKSIRQLNVYAGDTILKTYSISIGAQPIGKKIVEGDNKTPEGNYFIYSKNENSVCYKNLGISYPDSIDFYHAVQLGKFPGGDIKIHGLPNKQPFWGKFHRLFDWTKGCVAVTNQEMDELYNSVEIGTAIQIKP